MMRPFRTPVESSVQPAQIAAVRVHFNPAASNGAGRVCLSVYREDSSLDTDSYLRPTPQQAREIAAALLEAADEAEAFMNRKLAKQTKLRGVGDL